MLNFGINKRGLLANSFIYLSFITRVRVLVAPMADIMTAGRQGLLGSKLYEDIWKHNTEVRMAITCLWNNQRYNITFRTLILALIRNDFHYEVWHEITFTFPNFNGTQRCNLWSLKMDVISSHTLLGVWLHAISLHNEKTFRKAYHGIME